MHILDKYEQERRAWEWEAVCEWTSLCITHKDVGRMSAYEVKVAAETGRAHPDAVFFHRDEVWAVAWFVHKGYMRPPLVDMGRSVAVRRRTEGFGGISHVTGYAIDMHALLLWHKRKYGSDEELLAGVQKLIERDEAGIWGKRKRTSRQFKPMRGSGV